MENQAERTEEHVHPSAMPEGNPDAVNTEVWECASDGCKGWMRKKFSLDSSPECPLCQSPMVSGTRSIPKLKTEFKRRSINFARRNRH